MASLGQSRGFRRRRGRGLGGRVAPLGLCGRDRQPHRHGHALAGLVLLGLITSLPEMAVSVTASLAGEAALAVNNVLGSVAAQVAVLALADALIGREALTSVVVEPVVMLQAALNVLLLALVAAAITAGDLPLGGVGAWSSVLMLGYLASMWTLSGYEKRTSWTAQPAKEHEDEGRPPRAEVTGPGRRTQEVERRRRREEQPDRRPLRSLVVRTAVAAAVILAAGYLLSETGSAAAAQTGLGSAFFGATLVAVATSLPEISTMVAAVRLKRYEMALGDIFGTNLFNAALIFLIDAVYGGGPVLNEVGAFSAFGALLGLILTTIFLAGVVERRDRTVLRMGWDSLAALVIYAAGLGVLYALRGHAGQG
jgi:cation:H+ antiporter